MTDERRYLDEEVAQIFEAAATPQPSLERGRRPADGLTLAELQAIGREVGVAPERIADAAAALDHRRAAVPRQSHLKMPISVGRSVDLPRAPTEREWEILVAELRTTFGASGSDRSQGNLRAWTNGNLHAHIEPTETGYRLRLGTLKGDAVPLNLAGIGGTLLGYALLAGLAINGQIMQDFIGPVFISTMGMGALGYNALRLPRWARTREKQMEHIATRAQALITAPATEDAGVPEADR